MKTIKVRLLIGIMLILLPGIKVFPREKTWTLEECINYALEKNVSIQQAGLTNEKNKLYSGQALANRLPSVNASVNQNFNWYKGFDSLTGKYGSNSGSNNSNYSLSSSVTLYNGKTLSNKIKQADLNLQASQYNAETVKESISLSILNAYLEVLYADESVKNAEKQIESTTEQLKLAKERLNLGVNSMSDYLQIKSELATEKSTLASASNNLTTYKVALMQLMELPVDLSFKISSPNLDSLLIYTEQPNAREIYNLALGIKPQIKNAELTTESTQLDIEIAKAEALPSLSLNAGVSSNYSSLTDGSYSYQMKNQVNPSVGLSLSIPIYQKKQVKTDIGIAKISVADARLEEVNTKNELRKNVEQACVDVITAQTKYQATIDQYDSAKESYLVAEEKYTIGLVNSVDFLSVKTDMITSESEQLQAKYNLIFSYKILDFYKGIPLSLSK